MAATCTIVFALPHQLEAMITPCCVACMRVTVTVSSRAMMTIATHAARRLSDTSATSAAMISSLSAIGSMSLPNDVIALRVRAR